MGTRTSSARIIASRTLSLRPGDARVQVSIGIPELDPGSEGHDWRCPFQVSGLGASRLHYAHGIDAFQCLELALVGIRALLEPRRHALKWDGGALESAFPRMVPYGYGVDLSRRIESFIDREVEELNRKLERGRARRAVSPAKRRARLPSR